MTYGITESEFFSMTIAEIERAIKAKKEIEKRKATFDYVLADLIGRSVARVYNSENTLPTLAEAYPTLFNESEDNEALQRAKDEASALKFKLFAQSFNSNFKGGKSD
jgi:hypothetical protein